MAGVTRRDKASSSCRLCPLEREPFTWLREGLKRRAEREGVPHLNTPFAWDFLGSEQDEAIVHLPKAWPDPPDFTREASHVDLVSGVHGQEATVFVMRMGWIVSSQPLGVPSPSCVGCR